MALALTLLAAPAAGFAQPAAALRTLDIAAGAVQFDLSGVGTAPGIGVRGTLPLTSAAALNGGVLIAWPDEDLGRSTLVVPELHVHYHWRAGRVRPYAGGGVGVAVLSRSGGTRWNLSLAAASGARIELRDRLAVLGEFRLRGIERDFAGTTAEWMGGLSWLMR